MGGVYSSKRDDDAVVSPEDTKFLLGSTRHKRICNAYERISGGKGLDSKAFQIYVLGGFQMMVCMCAFALNVVHVVLFSSVVHLCGCKYS